MKQNNSINISVKQFLFEQPPLDAKSLLIKIEESGEIARIINHILENITDKDGIPKLNNIHISSLQLHEQNRKGKFRFSFTIDRIFCCSDMESCRPDYLDFDFELRDSELVASATYFNWELNN